MADDTLPPWFDPCANDPEWPKLSPEELAALQQAAKEGRYFGVTVLDEQEAR